jgi:hypothetical protein
MFHIWKDAFLKKKKEEHMMNIAGIGTSNIAPSHIEGYLAF